MTRPGRVDAPPTPILTSPLGVGGTTPMPALDDISDVDTSGVADGDVIVWDAGSSTWIVSASSTTADYLVGTAQAGLSAEIVVGTTPGGELGGTWASPTVDATHSGSAHHTESHASRHAAAGADSVKLDDLAAPDDNTDLNASTSAHGLLKKLPGGTTTFLRADGAFASVGGGGGGEAADGYTSYAATGGATIPGLRGSPDVSPASPHVDDDEFETTSTFSTVLGSLDTNNTTDIPSHLHLLKTATGTFQVHGVYKAIPSMPFTVTCKISDAAFSANFQAYGLAVIETGPGKLITFSHAWVNAASIVAKGIWASRTSRTSVVDVTQARPIQYLQMVVTSSTDVVCKASMNGLVWVTTHVTSNPGFTIADIGLIMTGNDNSVRVEAAFDWVRFT